VNKGLKHWISQNWVNFLHNWATISFSSRNTNGRLYILVITNCCITLHNTIKFSYRYVVDTLLGRFQITDIHKNSSCTLRHTVPLFFTPYCIHCVKVNRYGRIIVPPNGSSPNPPFDFKWHFYVHLY
jgi:hypothetical protein